MSTDLSLYQVDLDTSQANGRSGESPRSAFTKYNELVGILEGWNNTYISDSAPSPTYAFQQWIDTSSDPAIIKMRDSSDSSWVSLGSYDQSVGTAAGYDASVTSTSGNIPVAGSDGKLDNSWIDNITGDTINLSGAVTGEATFDGSGSVTIETEASNIAIPYPDLHIPFNDGLRIESGYGTNDQIDVSAAQDGSVMVDLPSMSVDFTRSSTSTVINKSGVLTNLAADEAGIGNGGVWLHGSYTNLLNKSEDVSYLSGSWIRTNGGIDSTGNTITTSGGFNLNEIEETNTNATASMIQSVTSISNDNWSVSCLISYSSSQYCRLGIEAYSSSVYLGRSWVVFDFTSETMTNDLGESVIGGFYFKKVESGIYQIFSSFDLSLDSSYDGYDEVRFNFAPATESTGLGNSTTGSTYVGCCQMINSSQFLPYLPTDTTTSTATATTCTVQVENNLPTTGYSWSLEQNLAIERDSSEDRFTFYLDSGDFYGFYVDTTGYLYLSDSTGNTQIGQIDDSGQHKVFICYDADNLNITAYDNKVEIGSITLSSQLTMPSSGNIHLGGADGDSHLNGQMGENKIWHNVALTADQVKSRG